MLKVSGQVGIARRWVIAVLVAAVAEVVILKLFPAPPHILPPLPSLTIVDFRPVIAGFVGGIIGLLALGQGRLSRAA